MADAARGAVGRDVPRIDGSAKAAGTARYIDDLTFPDMLHARTIRSSIARGTIRDIRCGFGPNDGFVVVDHRDIPGVNVVTLIEDDQPCLAEREVTAIANRARASPKRPSTCAPMSAGSASKSSGRMALKPGRILMT
jgi:CO/xanthine dehydrogenase Mo-binding subunit